jgi:hypothetical protein
MWQNLLYKIHALGVEGLYFDIKIGRSTYIRVRFW